ncbi:MAG: ABC transporter substrate-binding protein [Acidisphaera sp.]|nr:ABC transporter substrate-binding protein [Acidisphaera sp.]
MTRRSLLASAAAGAASLAAPARAAPAGANTIRFVPAADIAALDPVWTTASQTRDHAFLVYDTLFGLDDALQPQPQMVDSYGVDGDRLRWTLRLRDGLRFHDGEPVLARDCVASVKRWGVRDSYGQSLLAATDEIAAHDDKTLVFRLKQPFAALPSALGKYSSPCVIMPERLARTDAFTAVTDPTGSGPYRFLADERVPGAHLGYAKFDGYVPRANGATQGNAGPKIAYFEHVEWLIMPDGATAANALRSAEVDWLRWPVIDVVPMLKRAPGITVTVIEPLGLIGILRFNHLHPPFSNPAARQALLPALSQSDYMEACNGDDRSVWHDGIGFFTRGTPMASDAGLAALTRPRDLDAARKLLAASGYAGERTVVLQPTDFAIYKAMADVTSQLLKDIGFNVDLQAMDWATAMQRRNQPAPVTEGGWSVFHTGWGGFEDSIPITNVWLRGNGREAAPGWPSSPRLEELRTQWLAASDLAAQQTVARQMQVQAFADLPYLPTGQMLTPIAYRSDISGMLKGLPAFWNIRRAG